MKKQLLLFLIILITCNLKNNDYFDEIKVVTSEVYFNSVFIQEFDLRITKKLASIVETDKGYVIYTSYEEFSNDLIPSITNNIDISIKENHFENSIVIGFLISFTCGDTLKNHYIEIDDTNVFLKFEVDGYDGEGHPDLAITYVIFYKMEK